MVAHLSCPPKINIMIESLPIWIDALFIVTYMLTMALFYFANGKSKTLTLCIVIWSIGQAILAYTGFYQDTASIPPRFGLVLIPPFMLILYGLLSSQRIWLLESRDSLVGTFLHVVRVPVELVLYGLFTHQMIPELMTFEGKNFDILIGISAVVIGLLLAKGTIKTRTLLGWNIIGLGFVLFILINGILSAELPFQQFAFDQPNRASSYFPFVLLPATIVPIVVWTHLSEIVRLWGMVEQKNSFY